MRLKRVAAIVLVCLVLALLLASFHSLNSNNQTAFAQIQAYGEISQKENFTFTISTNTTNDFRINIGQGKMIEEINITLTNIIAPNNTITPEDHNSSTSPPKIPLYSPSYEAFLAMCFNITNDAYLDSVNVNLRVTSSGPFTITPLNLTILGADTNGQPVTYVTDKELNISQVMNDWLSIDVGHVFLNKNSVNNGVFFVCLQQKGISTTSIYWHSDPDNLGDYGPAYRNSLSGWSPLALDLNLRVNISANETGSVEIPDPNDINLTINGVDPVSSTYGSGFYQLYDIHSVGPYAYFNVSSPWDEVLYASNSPVNFDVEANYTVVDAPGPVIDPGLILLMFALTGSSQGGGSLLFFGGGGGVAAALVLVGVVAVVRSRRRTDLLNGLRKLSRVMALNVSGVNVFDFPLSEDESETDVALIAASISAVSSIEAEADTRESRATGGRDWFTTDKRVFFNLGSSGFIVDEAERSIFDGWWIGGVFDEHLTDSERNELRKVFRSLGDEAVRLARLDSNVFDNFVYWDGRTKVFKEFFLQVLNNGLRARGLSIERARELRLEGIQKLKIIFRLTEMGSSLLIEQMLSSLGNFESAVVCFNVSREMWARDVKNFLDRKQIKQLEKSAVDKEALLYSMIKGENIRRIQAAFIYLMLLMKNLASRNLKLDVIFFGLPAEQKVKKTGGKPAESVVESKIVLENINPSDPKTWNLFTQTLFDIVNKGEESSTVKMEFANVLKEIELHLQDRKDVEKTGIIIFTAGGLNTPQVVKMVSSQKLANTYTLLVGAPQEEKGRIPAQFIPIPAVSRENIEPFT